MQQNEKRLGDYSSRDDNHWTTVWSASVQGPYPAGNPTAQPDLSFALPHPTKGACDQSFRLMTTPSLWGKRARIRFTNALGKTPIRLSQVHVGLQLGSSALVAGTNCAVTFCAQSTIDIAPGASIWSDPVALHFVQQDTIHLLDQRRLAVSFHINGPSGPMTWHAKALQTSYLSPPGDGHVCAQEGEEGFPFPCASWFFIDAIDMAFDQPTPCLVCFGDSITDGSGSTVNGDDRWPDVLRRAIHQKYGRHLAIVNQGIGSNEILRPLTYDPDQATNGGPSALERLTRDVLSLSHVKGVIWLEGINDLGHARATADDLYKGVEQGVVHMRKELPGVKIFLATLLTSLGATTAGHGDPEVDIERRRFNDLLRASKIHDGLIDFEQATLDPTTGRMRADMKPGSSIGGAGDGLHPNRLGYQAMAQVALTSGLVEKLLA